MAVAPLFVADIDTLQAELRLTGLRSGSDGEQILFRAASSARVTLYQRLGLPVVTDLLAIADVDNPTTSDQIRRKAATLVEVEMVRCELIETMPVMLGDASGDAQQSYNDEGVWRQIAPDERIELLNRCRTRIEELIELILDEDGLGNDVSIKAFDGSRATDTRRFPAGSAFPAIGLFPGNFESTYHVGNGYVPVRFELPDEDA
jgi:hypothetical protein